MNPSVSLTFFRLGKISPWDLVFYILAQLLGIGVGVLIGTKLITPHLVHPLAEYLVTIPGMHGWTSALALEGGFGFATMLVILYFSNHPQWEPFTGIMAALVVMAYFALAAPFMVEHHDALHPSGLAFMHLSTAALVYFSSPPLGMLAAAEFHHLWKGHVACAKLNHSNDKRCIFCEYQQSKSKLKPNPA